ncbi:MAG: ribonuclease III [Caldisericia bacterium]|nr:ribonuclease III [Caldisericia bacterium]
MSSIDDFISFIENNYKIKIKNKQLIIRSLVHTSKENFEPPISFERLEFLGDSIINFLITERVFKKYRNVSEGVLAKYKAILISKETLSKFAKILKINEYITLGKGEEKSGGREKENILCDAFESFIGALYLDSGLRTPRKIINKLMNFIIIEKISDSKTYLQEITQKKFELLPKYSVLEIKGLEHDKTYVVGVFINDKIIGIGEGKSKKEAEKRAANEAIKYLTQNEKIY